MKKKLNNSLDFKLLSILSLVYLVINLINFGKNLYFKWLGFGFKEYSYYSMLYNMLINWLVVSLFAAFLIVLVKILLRKKTPIFSSILIHIFFSFFIGAFAIWVDFIGEGTINVFALETRKMFFNGVIRLADLHFLVYLSFITIIYMYYYFKRLRERDVQNHQLKEQLSKSHLQFLQSQLHPHFLFNTLNGIHSLMPLALKNHKAWF